MEDTQKNTANDRHLGENRPRLRKIKRPKQHNGPIGANMPQSVNRPQNPASAHGNLVKADSRDMYNPNFNNAPVNNYIDDSDPFPDDEFVYQGNDRPNNQMTFDTKKMLIISCISVVIGLILGSSMFSSGKEVVRDGLQGVVVNPEVPNGRPRCGIAEKTQGCVLYIMNPQRQDLNGRDFYDLAAQLTGRQRFVVETGNMRYATVKVKPGNIAQLNIPPLQ